MSTRDTDSVRWFSFETVSRHDLVLAVIPSVFLLALLISIVFSLPPQITLGGGSLLASASVVDALFINPPRGPSRGGAA